MNRTLAPFLFFSILTFAMSDMAFADRGQQLFHLCASCHGDQAQGRQDLAAPAIAGMEEWYIVNQLHGFREGKRGLHPDDHPGIRMRPMARTLNSEEDLKAVAAYVAKLPKPALPGTFKGRPLVGQKTFDSTCKACHGDKAQGMKVLNAPSLVATNDWYLLTQLKNFKSGLRGADPAKDPTGATMAPMAKTLEDEQAMKDVIFYIQSLR